MQRDNMVFREGPGLRPAGRPRYFYYSAQLPRRDQKRVTYNKKGEPVIKLKHLWEPKSRTGRPVVVLYYDKRKKVVSYRRYGCDACMNDVAEEKFRRMYVPYDLPVVR